MREMNEDTWAVLELSNFQLYKFNYSPHIAVHLMMIPEHIAEWHKTMEDYVGAKRNIFAHQSSNDIAIYMDANQYSKENALASPGKKIPFFTPPGAFVSDGSIYIESTEVISIDEVGLLGSHNLQNICAALTAAWNVHQDIDAYRKVIREFKGLEHRLQLSGVIDGVAYYDDSFGTTPDTAIVALDSFSGSKIAIVGGHDKGNDYSELAKRLARDDIKHVIFIGTTAGKLKEMAIQAGLDSSRITIKDDGNSWTMPEIVLCAREHAASGDTVLLSTGSASFGLFRDYKDRGEQFTRCVQELAN